MHPPTEPVSRFSKSLEILVTTGSRKFLKRETDAGLAKSLENLIRASRALDRSRARHLKLTDVEARAVAIVFERHGVGPTALARALNMTTAAVTSVIDRLCRSGHLSRSEHPTDRRRVQLYLSYPTTRRMLEQRKRLRAKAGTAADELTASERNAVIGYLNTVAMLWRRELPLVKQKAPRHRGASHRNKG